MILRGARVIDATRDAVADQAVPGAGGDRDATGLVVAPGFVDLHCDLADPGHVHREGLESGLRAAARGGFTAVCPTPATEPPIDRADAVERMRARAAQICGAAALPIGASTVGLDGTRLSEIHAMAAAGAVAVGDGGRPIADPGLQRRIMEYAAAADLPVFVWPATAGFKGVMHEGPVATRLGLAGVPAASEEIAVARAIALCDLTGARVHVGPVTTRAAVRLLADAKARAVPITASTTAVHLSLTDAAVAEAYDPNLHVQPPLRPRADVDALIGAVREGVIDAVGSGHVPRTLADKAQPFASAAPGMTGLETCLGLLMRLVQQGALTLADVIRVLAIGPRGILGLPDALGDDWVLFEPDAHTRIAARASRAQNSPFLGQALPGRIHLTCVAGDIAWDADAEQTA